jgi:hypothetical protein
LPGHTATVAASSQLQRRSDAAARGSLAAVSPWRSPSVHRTKSWEAGMGKFALGFIIAIILVIFIVVQCAQALF